jgi:hypothetical protein
MPQPVLKVSQRAAGLVDEGSSTNGKAALPAIAVAHQNAWNDRNVSLVGA